MKNIVEISFVNSNFSACVPSLPGCVSVGDTPMEVKNNINEAITIHLKGMVEDGDKIPSGFLGEFQLSYKFDTVSLLNYYKGIFTNAALEKLTGINQKQIQHYATGLKKPRLAQRKKIEQALHQLGRELITVEL